MKLAWQLRVGASIGLGLLALVPLLDRGLNRADRARRIDAAALAHFGDADRALPARATGLSRPGWALSPPSSFAGWASIGGCGAGGGSASGPGGGIQWIGRNVTGGRIDAQALSTVTYAHGNQFTTVATRLRTSVSPHWGLALNLPIVRKAGEVSVLGMTKPVHLTGFGDVSLEAAYKFGRIAAHQMILNASVPTGSSDAVRQGVVLPQHLQLGSGVPGATLQYQHTRDSDWGLLLLGGTASYAGPENSLGDFRAPSATIYGHVGYLAGRLVPAAGLTLFGKAQHDRERGFDRTGELDPRAMLVPSLSCEWSTDWIAILPAATAGLSRNGLESVSIGIGIASSLF